MNYKLTLVSSVLLLFSITSIAQTPPSADEVLNTAYKQAAAEKKNVFLLFHASWCGWCHKMDTAMNDPKVQKFFTDNYVICHLTVYESDKKKNLENPGALDLLTKHKGNDLGIPYWIVFDKDGKALADSRMTDGNNTGCPANKVEVEHFIAALKRTSSLQPQQLSVIEKRFRENEN